MRIRLSRNRLDRGLPASHRAFAAAARAFLVATSLGVLTGGAALTVLSSGATDALGVTCSGSPLHNVEATNDPNGDHRGVGAGALLVSNPSVTCVHVSSLGLITSGGDFVEFGWSRDNPSNILDCAGTGTDGHPYIFREDNKNGGARCFQGEDVPSADIGFGEEFLINDPNQDDIFVAHYNGALVGTGLTETFSGGHPIDNGEQHNTNDTMSANFDSLEFNNGAWALWSSHSCYFDNSTAYSNNFSTPDHDVISTTDGGDTC